ncbi:MAG TPA: FtsX-like permease family protein, partial [Bryobacteraceae bacterium]|nr:FtsX-like permease family protein [Bryobacteraceae bacterium]
ARQREVAIRGALGASRSQIVRQLFAESLILATAGGITGLVLSIWLTRGLVRFLPYDPAILSVATTPDARVLVFTTAVTLGTAFIFGLIPAFRGARVPPSATLREEAGSITGGHGHVQLRKAFVAVQVALSALLLIGAGLFLRTLDNLRRVNLGFNTENVVMFGVRPAVRYEDGRKLQLFRTTLDSLAAVPGVKAVGANTTRLLMGGRWDSQISIPGVEMKNGNVPWSFFNAVTPGYFEALGIPIRMGRGFSWRDWGSDRKLCLVNEALVNEYLGGANPVGRRMGQGRSVAADMDIIGVFGNARYHDVRGEVPRQTFVNLDSRIRQTNSFTVYARIQGDPRQIMPALREQVRRVDSNLVVFDMRTLNDQLNLRLSNERMLSLLSAGFALLATILAVVGLHGVLAFVVTRRTREIGIRMALGAAQGAVVRLVMREMLAMILLGLTTGLAGAWLSGRYVETQLFGVRAADAPVFAMSVATLLAASLAGSLVPALRASRISPSRALRHE